MTDFPEALVQAFPDRLAVAARTAICRLPPTQLPASVNAIGPVRIGGHLVHIPARVYLRGEPELSPTHEASIADRITICLWTRHDDGYMRERAVKALLPVSADWEVPFVIQLVGEYVVEIVTTIEDRLFDAQKPIFRSFLRENGEFIALTRQRLISYWNCYYRTRWLRIADYPGMRAMTRLEEWANSDAT